MKLRNQLLWLEQRSPLLVPEGGWRQLPHEHEWQNEHEWKRRILSETVIYLNLHKNQLIFFLTEVV